MARSMARDTVVGNMELNTANSFRAKLEKNLKCRIDPRTENGFITPRQQRDRHQ
jgi:hypothetical protein